MLIDPSLACSKPVMSLKASGFALQLDCCIPHDADGSLVSMMHTCHKFYLVPGPTDDSAEVVYELHTSVVTESFICRWMPAREPYLGFQEKLTSTSMDGACWCASWYHIKLVSTANSHSGSSFCHAVGKP